MMNAGDGIHGGGGRTEGRRRRVSAMRPDAWEKATDLGEVKMVSAGKVEGTSTERQALTRRGNEREAMGERH